MKLWIPLIAIILVASMESNISAQEAFLSIVPESGPCGTTVRVAGSGFPPNVDMVVFARDAGPREFDNEPVTRTDASGNFQVEVEVPIERCPSELGMIVFACPANSTPVCEPKVSLPFTVAASSGLPSTGDGPSDKPPGPMPLYVAFGGALMLAAGIAVRNAARR